MSRLTPGGPGTLNKSFWSSSWYFCVSWQQTETCCCQPKAQTLYSSCLCSVCVCVCEQTLKATQPYWTGVLDLPAEPEPHWSITHYSRADWNTLPHQSNHSHTDCLKGQYQTTSVFMFSTTSNYNGFSLTDSIRQKNGYNIK